MKKLNLPLCPKNPDFLPIGRDKPWLAPLAGYSDLPFRSLCREYGAAVCVTEMISAQGLVYGSSGTFKLLESTEYDQPLVVQLFGSKKEFLLQAIKLLSEKAYGWFDFNMGCPVPKVLKQGSGGALLLDLNYAFDLISSMIDIVGFGRMGIKIRRSYDGNVPSFDELINFLLRLQDIGLGWVSVHPRTTKQKYTGKADWNVIADLKKYLSIPIIASGDLLSASDGINCMNLTSADCVMYARGALYNPAIFLDHKMILSGKDSVKRDILDIKNLIIRHMDLTKKFNGDKAFLKLRSILPRYVRNFSSAKHLREALCHCTDWKMIYETLEKIFIKD